MDYAARKKMVGKGQGYCLSSETLFVEKMFDFIGSLGMRHMIHCGYSSLPALQPLEEAQRWLRPMLNYEP